jgi:hypothetical protein
MLLLRCYGSTMNTLRDREPVVKRSISLPPDRDAWLVEEAWRRRTTVSGLLAYLVDFYRSHEKSDNGQRSAR